MKKHLTTFLSFALTMLMAFTLTNCGSEVEIDDNNGIAVKPGQTVFSTGNNATRTSMDADRYFYWEPGDNIWVNSTGTTYLRSTSNSIGTQKKVPACNFVFDATLTNDTYPVLYTGNDQTATSATSVTIANQQEQSLWNDASHLGKSGDCGTAKATKQANGTYEFHLQHRAAYLVFKPNLSTNLTAQNTVHKIIKIEIIADGTNISGTYGFTYGETLNSGGLSASPTTTSAKDNTVELVCGKAGFVLNTLALNSCFAVINPGTHTLTVRYYREHSAYGTNSVYVHEQVLQMKKYNPNGVTTIEYTLEPTETSPIVQYDLKFYQWDAPGDNPVFAGDSWVDYSSHVVAPARATNTAANMPNVNELWWYLENGDPHWDETQTYMIKGSPDVYNAGMWIKKRNKILTNNTLTKCENAAHGGNGPTFCSEHGKNGTDLRVQFEPGMTKDYNSNVQEFVLGRPENINDYFFLPAFGYLVRRGDVWEQSGQGSTVYFWSSSAMDWTGWPAEHIKEVFSNDNFAYSFACHRSRCDINSVMKHLRWREAFVVGTRPDGTPWFQ